MPSQYNLPLTSINWKFIACLIAHQADESITVFVWMIQELIEVKSDNFALSALQFSNADISLMIDYICRYSDEP